MTWRELFVAVAAGFGGWYVGGMNWASTRVFLFGASYVFIVVLFYYGFFSNTPKGPTPLSNNEGGS